MSNNVVHDMTGNMRVESSKDVIQKDDISTGIHCTGKADPSSLTTTERDALLADKSLVTV
jgi:hypothetical protein